MERDVWLVTDNPAVVRYRRNVKQLACSQLEYSTIVERGGRSARQDKTNMLHMASRGADTRPDVLAPLPAWLVGGAANGHSSEAHQVETAFLKHANFIGRFETLENNGDSVAIHDAETI